MGDLFYLNPKTDYTNFMMMQYYNKSLELDFNYDVALNYQVIFFRPWSSSGVLLLFLIFSLASYGPGSPYWRKDSCFASLSALQGVAHQAPQELSWEFRLRHSTCLLISALSALSTPSHLHYASSRCLNLAGRIFQESGNGHSWS